MNPTIFPAPSGSVAVGSDPRIAGLAIKRRIGTYGPHVVLVDAHGRVFIRPSDDPRAALMAARHPHMVVGTFNDSATSREISEDLIFVYNGLLNGEAA